MLDARFLDARLQTSERDTIAYGPSPITPFKPSNLFPYSSYSPIRPINLFKPQNVKF